MKLLISWSSVQVREGSPSLKTVLDFEAVFSYNKSSRAESYWVTAVKLIERRLALYAGNSLAIDLKFIGTAIR